MRDRRRSMEALPDEILMKILEIGVENSIMRCADVCSFSICCKHFNKLSNDDTLWSLLLNLDFPYYQNNATSSRKNLYKCRLARCIKRKLASLEYKLDKDMCRQYRLSQRIERLGREINGIGDQIREICGEFLQMIKDRNLLHPDLLDETARKSAQEPTTMFAEVETWLQAIALSGQAPPLASVANSTSAPSSSTPTGSSSSFVAPVHLQMKLQRLRSLHEGFRSTHQQNRSKIDILARHFEDRKIQQVVLTSRLALLGTCSHLTEADDDGVDEAEDTDDDYFDDDTEDDYVDDDTEDDYVDDDSGFDYDSETTEDDDDAEAAEDDDDAEDDGNDAEVDDDDAEDAE